MPGAAVTAFFLDSEDWQPVAVPGPVGPLVIKPFEENLTAAPLVDTLTVSPQQNRITVTVSPASIEVDGTET